ncbi:MAG: S66 peptidase family protein [Victivallaceae bacterium]
MNSLFPNNFVHAAIISPAGPADRTRVESGAALLREWGMKVTIMPHVFGGTRENYLSASAAERLSDLHACWNDASIDLVLCARGGFGSAHLLPEINWGLLRSRPLPLIGYSDITALHMAMLKMDAGIPVSAPMAAKLYDAVIEDKFAEYTADYYRAAMHGLPIQIKNTDGDNPVRIIKPGSVSALPLVANLAVIVTLCGTEYFPDVTGRVLILEDLNEPAYRIDRYMTQLKQTGILSRCAGVVFGDFLDCGTNEELQLIFHKAAESVNGPVITGFPFGHGLPIVSIRMDRQFRLTGSGEVFIGE